MNKFILTIAVLLGSTFVSAQTTNPSPYCDASFDDAQGFVVDDHINSVSFGTLNNTSNSQQAAPHYVFYNNLSPVNFNIGDTYNLIINFTTAGGCGYGVWIDYNLNNIFEDSEKIAGTSGTEFLDFGTTSTVNKQITIPSTASVGITRMRVRIVEDDNHNYYVSTDELACNASSSNTDVMDWGETEDYTIFLTTVTTSKEKSNPSKPNFTLFPNPSTGIFTLTTDNNQAKSIEVCTILGNTIHKQLIYNSTTKIDLSEQSGGIYFVRLLNESNQVLYSQKIIVK